MITLTIISALLITLYTISVCVKGKCIPYSISATFYALEHKFLFGATMVMTASLLMPAILYKTTDENYQFTAFLACIGMIMTGVAPNFKDGIEKKIHTTGAVLCLVFSQLWVFLTCPWILLLWVAYITYTAFYVKNNWKGNFISAFLLSKPMFWVEVMAFITVYITLIF